MVDLTIFKAAIESELKSIGCELTEFKPPKIKRGYDCRFSDLLHEKTLPPDLDMDLLCQHEDECEIVSKLIKKHEKENTGIDLFLRLKLETYKKGKLPIGKLKIL